MISRPLAAISAVGWLLALGLSVAVAAGARIPSRLLLEALLLPLFALWLGAYAALSLAMKNTPFTPPSWFRRAIDRAPQWAKFALWGSVAYVIIAAAAGLIFRERVQMAVGSAIPAMMFIFPVVAFSTTSISLNCPKGHVVGPFEQYCPTCGAPILDNA